MRANQASFAGDFSAAFFNTPSDPEDATNSWDGPGVISCPNTAANEAAVFRPGHILNAIPAPACHFVRQEQLCSVTVVWQPARARRTKEHRLDNTQIAEIHGIVTVKVRIRIPRR